MTETAGQRPDGPHIFIVAGEESGDKLAAALISALKRRTGGKVRFSGVGGEAMAKEGVASLFPLGDLAIVGFTSIAGNIAQIKRRIRETANAVIAARPDVLVIVDSPEFTHRVARRVRKRAPQIPIVDYVSPSVWAWRPWRARAMKRYVDHVMALLPFEPAAHERLGGPPCTYVGHPLTEMVSELRPNAEGERRRQSAPALILVMPGSRRGEIERMLPVFAPVIASLPFRIGDIEVVMPAVPHLAETVQAAVAKWRPPVKVVVDPLKKQAAFRNARAALVKSGTGTLELALARVPMVAAYKVSPLEAMVGRIMLNVPSVILANLVLGENAVPEFLQEDCVPQKLLEALNPLLEDTPQRRGQLAAFDRLDKIMEVGKIAPSDRAASIILDFAADSAKSG